MIEAKEKIIHWCKILSEKVNTAGISGVTAEKIAALAEDARERQLVVPVVGAFSAGKSSMINSLLGEDVLTVDIRPETSLATELYYSPNACIEAVKSDNGIDKYKVDEIDKVKENAAKYLYARLYLNNNNLREIEPLVLVDMPGFDSPLDLHNKAIMAYLDRGCFYIVLSSVEEGTITKTLERRLKEIEGWGREFAFFLSKANLRPQGSLNQLTAHYQKQLDDGCITPVKVIPLENNSGDKVLQCLKNININHVFGSIYRGNLLDVCDDIVNAINLQINASKKDAAKNIEAIKEMEESVEKLRKKAESELEDMRRKYSGSLVNEVITDASRYLNNSLEELTMIALSGNQEELKRTLNDIVRSALSVSFKERLEGLAKEISIDFSESLQGLDKVMKDLNLNENYMQDMIGKVERLMDDLMKFDPRVWANSSTSRKDGMSLQGELIPKQPDEQALKMGFKALAGAGLASSVINPIIGVVVMFIPELLGEILKLFGGGANIKERQKEKIRSEFSGRVFPDIKTRLRAEIPGQIRWQIDLMIKEVGEKYKEQIEKQSEIIKGQAAEKSMNKEEAEAKLKQLEAVSSDVQAIASEIKAWEK